MRRRRPVLDRSAMRQRAELHVDGLHAGGRRRQLPGRNQLDAELPGRWSAGCLAGCSVSYACAARPPAARRSAARARPRFVLPGRVSRRWAPASPAPRRSRVSRRARSVARSRRAAVMRQLAYIAYSSACDAPPPPQLARARRQRRCRVLSAPCRSRGRRHRPRRARPPGRPRRFMRAALAFFFFFLISDFRSRLSPTPRESRIAPPLVRRLTISCSGLTRPGSTPAGGFRPGTPAGQPGLLAEFERLVARWSIAAPTRRLPFLWPQGGRCATRAEDVPHDRAPLARPPGSTAHRFPGPL